MSWVFEWWQQCNNFWLDWYPTLWLLNAGCPLQLYVLSFHIITSTNKLLFGLLFRRYLCLLVVHLHGFSHVWKQSSPNPVYYVKTLIHSHPNANFQFQIVTLSFFNDCARFLFLILSMRFCDFWNLKLFKSDTFNNWMINVKKWIDNIKVTLKFYFPKKSTYNYWHMDLFFLYCWVVFPFTLYFHVQRNFFQSSWW